MRVRKSKLSREFFIQHQFKIYIFFSLLLSFFSIASRLKFNGSIFGFDYNLFYPDGMYYSQKTLEFSGIDPHDAANIVANKYLNLNPGVSEYRGETESQIVGRLLDKKSQIWNFVDSRLFYPFISSFVVKFFGINGMLIFPIIAFVTLLIGIQILGLKLQNPNLALILILILTTSLTIPRWMISNLTDPILTAIFTFVPLIIIYVKNQKNLFSLLLILIVTSTFTRFALPIWFGILLVLYARKYSPIMILCTGLVTTLISIYPILTSLPSVQNSYESNDNMLTQSMKITMQSFKIIFIEIAQLAVLDRALLLLVLLAICVSLFRISEVSSQMCISTIVGCTLLEIIPGVAGVNFRYYLPALPFMCWSILANIRVKRHSIS